MPSEQRQAAQCLGDKVTQAEGTGSAKGPRLDVAHVESFGTMDALMVRAQLPLSRVCGGTWEESQVN